MLFGRDLVIFLSANSFHFTNSFDSATFTGATSLSATSLTSIVSAAVALETCKLLLLFLLLGKFSLPSLPLPSNEEVV